MLKIRNNSIAAGFVDGIGGGNENMMRFNSQHNSMETLKEH